tara:strand:- start:1554 stop:2870 length:1317 start_codon:yes stop_codon:yes gene_type:complete
LIKPVFNATLNVTKLKLIIFGVTMARTTKPLSDTEVKNAKPQVKEYNLADGHGLMLRIKPNGNKSWIFNYQKPFIKKRANLTLGKYPELTLAVARKKKQQYRELLASDIDPKEHKQLSALNEIDRISTTLVKVGADWFAIKSTKVSHETGKRIWNSLVTHIFNDLGDLPISQITAPVTIDTLKPIAAKGSLELVRRLSQRLNEIMVYAVNTGTLVANPLQGINAAFEAPKAKHHPTLLPSELIELMHELSYASIKLVTRCLIEWQLHTMSRPSEASSAKWCEIDLENSMWNIPACRMKMNKEHQVPLTKQTISLLNRMRAISGHREFIFPANNNHLKPTNSETANNALKRMGFKGRIVSHGIRSLASTTLNEKGFDFDIIESALSHQDSNSVRRAYNHAQYIERRRVMMTWWSEHIERCSKGDYSLMTTSAPLRLVNG